MKRSRLERLFLAAMGLQILAVTLQVVAMVLRHHGL